MFRKIVSLVVALVIGVSGTVQAKTLNSAERELSVIDLSLHYESRLREQTQKLVLAEKEISQLKNKYEADIAKYTSALAEKYTQVRSAELDLHQAESDLKKLRLKISRLEKGADKRQSVVENLTKKLKKFEKENQRKVGKSDKMLATLEEKIANKDEEIEKLKNISKYEKERLTGILLEREKKIDEIENIHLSKNAEFKKIRLEIDKAKKESDSLRSQHQELRDAMNAVTEEKNKQILHNDELKEKIKKLNTLLAAADEDKEKAYNDFKKEYETLKAAVETKEKDISAYVAKLRSKDKELSKVQDLSDEQKKNLDELKQKVKEIANDGAERTKIYLAQIDELSKSLERSKQKQKDDVGKEDVLNKKNSELKEQLSQKTKVLEQLKVNFDEHKDKFEKDIADTEQKRLVLVERLKKSEAQYSTCKIDLENTRNESAKVLETKNSEISLLKKQLKTFDVQLAELKDEVRVLSKETTEKDTLISDLDAQLSIALEESEVVSVKLRAENESLKNNLKTSIEKQKEAQGQAARDQQRVVELEQAFLEVSEERDRLEEKERQLSPENKRLIKENSDLIEQLSAMEIEFKIKSQEHETNLKKIAAMETEVVALRKSTVNAKEENSALEEKYLLMLNDTQSEAIKLKESKQLLERQLEELQNKLVTSEMELNKSLASNSSLKVELKDLKSKKTDSAKKLDSIERDYSAKLKEARAEALSLREQNKNLSAELKSEQNQLKVQLAELEKSSARVKLLSDDKTAVESNLKQQIVDLERKLMAAESKLTAIVRSNSSLKVTLKALKSKKSGAAKKLESVEKKYSLLLKESQADMQTLKGLNKNLSADLNLKKEELKTKSAEVEQFKADFVSLSNEKEETDSSYKKQIKVLMEKVRQLETNEQSKAMELTKLDKQLGEYKSIDTKLLKFKAELLESKEKNKALESDLDINKQKLKISLDDLAKTSRRCQQIEEKNNILDKSLRELKENKKIVEDKLFEQKNLLLKKDSLLATISKEKDSVKAELHDSAKKSAYEIAELKARVVELGQEFLDLSTERDELEQDLISSKKIQTKSESAIQELQASIEELKKKLSKKDVGHKATRKENIAMKAELRDLRKDLTSLTAELERSRLKSLKLQEMRDKENAEHATELKTIKTYRRQLQEEISKLEQENE